MLSLNRHRQKITSFHTKHELAQLFGHYSPPRASRLTPHACGLQHDTTRSPATCGQTVAGPDPRMPLTVAADAPVILGPEHDIGEFARRPDSPLTTFPMRPEQAITTSVAGLRAALNRQSPCNSQTEAWVVEVSRVKSCRVLDGMPSLARIISSALPAWIGRPSLALPQSCMLRLELLLVLRPQKSGLHGIKAVVTGRQQPQGFAIDGAVQRPRHVTHVHP